MIKVGVAVAPSFKQIPGWEEKFKQRLAYASDIFRREFGIRFEPAAFWDWPARSEQKGTHHLLDELQQGFPLHGVDLIIGLTRLARMPDLTDLGDLHVLGRARPFSGYAVIRYPNDPLFRVQEETVLAHELGHLFGATHTEDRNSIMAPAVEKQIPTRFDVANREVIQLTRNLDFKAGFDRLDPGTTQQLIGSYLKLMVYQQPLEFYYMLGVFYLKSGNLDEALNTWKKAAEINDENPQIHFDLGMLYSRLGFHKQAIRELGEAVSGFSMPWQRPRKAAALNALGEAYLKEGGFLPAYNAFSRAFAIDPENVEIQINLALVQIRRGQFDAAIKSLRSILKDHPDHARAMGYLGTAYYEKGRYPEAINHLEKALRIIGPRPKNPSQGATHFEIYSNLGAVYLKMKDQDRALASYQAACLSQESLDCHRQMGMLYFNSGKWEDAAREMSMVVQKQPDTPELYGPLGVALSQIGQDQQALSVFQEGLRYVKDRGDLGRLHSNIGHMYLQAMHPEMAEKDFQLAIAADWKNLDAHLGLALAELKMNNLAGARQSLRNILQMKPDHAQAQELLARVEEMIEASSQPTTVSFRPRTE